MNNVELIWFVIMCVLTGPWSTMRFSQYKKVEIRYDYVTYLSIHKFLYSLFFFFAPFFWILLNKKRQSVFEVLKPVISAQYSLLTLFKKLAQILVNFNLFSCLLIKVFLYYINEHEHILYDTSYSISLLLITKLLSTKFLGKIKKWIFDYVSVFVPTSNIDQGLHIKSV